MRIGHAMAPLGTWFKHLTIRGKTEGRSNLNKTDIPIVFDYIMHYVRIVPRVKILKPFCRD